MEDEDWELVGAGWEPINTNIQENIGVSSQNLGVSIGVCGVLNKFKYLCWSGQHTIGII